MYVRTCTHLYSTRTMYMYVYTMYVHVHVIKYFLQLQDGYCTAHSRVSLLVLYGRETSLSGQKVTDISCRCPSKKSVEHSLTHLEGGLLSVHERLTGRTRLRLCWVVTDVGTGIGTYSWNGDLERGGGRGSRVCMCINEQYMYNSSQYHALRIELRTHYAK